MVHNVAKNKAEKAYEVIDDIVNEAVISDLRVCSTLVDGLEKKRFLLGPGRLAVYDGLIRGHVAEFVCAICVASGDGRII